MLSVKEPTQEGQKIIQKMEDTFLPYQEYFHFPESRLINFKRSFFSIYFNESQ
jgi:hypothetical protein